MRDKLLQIFNEHKNDFVSGQELSKKMGISRTAIWKHIEELRKNGYELEAVPRRGYRMISRPNTVQADEIKAKVSTLRLGKEVIYKERIGSTQEEAYQLAREGVGEGTVVIADEQTKGKGRLGRNWYSPPGTGLWLSVILRPNIPPFKAPQLTLLTAVAVAEGIKEICNLEVDIKWPNDLLIHGKKIAGILTEMQSDPDRVQAVIVGIGLNVNQSSHHFAEDLSDKATSLAIEAGEVWNRSNVAACILERFEYWYDQFLHAGFDNIRKRWEDLAITIGQKITARTIQGEEKGRAIGITDDGVLKLQTDEGELKHIYSADIEIHPPSQR